MIVEFNKNVSTKVLTKITSMNGISDRQMFDCCKNKPTGVSDRTFHLSDRDYSFGVYIADGMIYIHDNCNNQEIVLQIPMNMVNHIL